MLTETVNSSVIPLLCSKDCPSGFSLNKYRSPPELIVSEHSLTFPKMMVSLVL